MKVDASIVKSYLQGKEDYTEHWLFYNILENGEYVFDRPDSAYRGTIEELLEKTYGVLNHFKPYNADMFSKLFPKWEELMNDVNVILAVGCPAPYDAMVREYDGKEYMIFDLIRFLDYQKAGEDILALIRRLITHEISHICIHTDYPVSPVTYREKLAYITFDEGFAHILSLLDDISSYNFSPMIEAHYLSSVKKLENALSETDSQKQEENLAAADCGSYWDKFAAISGKLYLAAHLNEIYEIYENGPSAMFSNILRGNSEGVLN